MSKTGVVKLFDVEKGWGFIKQDVGGKDLFVHRSNISDNQILVERDLVHYDEGWSPTKDKAMAENITGGTGGPIDSFCGGNGGGRGGANSGRGSDCSTVGGSSVRYDVPWRVDLHECLVEEAKDIVLRFLKTNIRDAERIGERRTVKIVYGRGRHSKLHGCPVVRPAIWELVSKMCLEMEWINESSMHVILPNSKFFTTTVNKVAGMSLGIQIQRRDSTLRINAIYDDGWIAELNKTNETPLRVHDSIIEVNRIQGTGIILSDEIKSKETLVLKVTRVDEERAKELAHPSQLEKMNAKKMEIRRDFELPRYEDMDQDMENIVANLLLCGCDEFLKTHGLKGKGSTKKVRQWVHQRDYKAIKEIVYAFQRTASSSEMRRYNDSLGSARLVLGLGSADRASVDILR